MTGAKQSPENLFYCGTSNVVLPEPNKAFFPLEYQDKTRLSYYSSLFNTVEINSTFYRLPMPRTVEKWANEVPDEFCFTFKLWREITHARELSYHTGDVGKFLDVINNIGEKKGCLLVQFPASIRMSYFSKVRRLLDALSDGGKLSGWHLAVEFRDRSWYTDVVYEMLEHYKAAIVVHDMPRSATPSIEMQQHVAYLRFHGEEGDYKGSYSSDFLGEYATYVQSRLAKGQPVFAYFNNTIGDAFRNAITLNQYVTAPFR
ncbi:MAG TPA: DUF72 domain-containing protein [Flavipsychrobacter sp.]|nr:DUF72 domain-containing protein [Flavipsychrobacter sp.]